MAPATSREAEYGTSATRRYPFLPRGRPTRLIPTSMTRAPGLINLAGDAFRPDPFAATRMSAESCVPGILRPPCGDRHDCVSPLLFSAKKSGGLPTMLLRPTITTASRGVLRCGRGRSWNARGRCTVSGIPRPMTSRPRLTVINRRRLSGSLQLSGHASRICGGNGELDRIPWIRGSF